ncbi:ABC transporter permease [Selenomonas montiformis]|uniref:Transport permease protein n=1 Tax=Selenomonas montiformis TaxID=2652285 RepID=A0A6I2UZK5_9FIRM|nr:ABC transporter permease [Selenomonas montiformis]MDY4697352.1 ABC transporter permease [Selenomonas montiformis]MSV25101.1 multidrug ABC transporter permease [Selenomonas montiformis]
MLYDIWTVFWRDWIVLKRRMTKFILSRMVAPMLYLIAFGWGLGRSIQVDSGTYLDFLVPGILALNSMNISFNSITPVHAERIYHKSLEEYILAPICPDAFVLGKVLAAVLRGLISSAIIILLSLAFGAHFFITPLFVFVLILNGMIFAEIGFLAAMKIRTYEEMGQVNTYILLPMSFLCGTFFSTQALPELVRCFIELLPLTHTSFLLRSIGSGAVPSLYSVAVLFVYAAAGLWLGSRSFRRLTR